MIAIGGGGYVPARILRYLPLRFPFPNCDPANSHTHLVSYGRSFLKRPGQPNIPIQAIGLSLYEDLGRGDPEETPGTKVTRTQWLDLSSLEMANLIGKNILIVDEVDDTRTTLEYAVRELQKDVETAQKQLGREGEKTNFYIFVLHVCCPGLLCWSDAILMAVEQEQAEKGCVAVADDGVGALSLGTDNGGRVDLLPVGGQVRQFFSCFCSCAN